MLITYKISLKPNVIEQLNFISDYHNTNYSDMIRQLVQKKEVSEEYQKLKEELSNIEKQ